MKRLFLLSAVTLLIASYGGSDKEKAADDSARADSIAAVEAQHAAEAAQQAHLDSLRQDSINQAEIFASKIPSFKLINENEGEQLESIFKSHGFTVSYTYGKSWNPDALDMTSVKQINATLKMGDKECTYREHFGDNGTDYTMIIKGAPEKLNEYATEAKSYIAKMKRQNPGDWYYGDTKVKVSGNTVTIHYPMGD